MLRAEKTFIDKLLKTGRRLPKEVLFQDPKILLRIIRKRLRMTQQQLAKRAKLPQSTIARIESGKISPSYETLQKVFHALHCSITLLLVPEALPDTLLKKQALAAAKKRVKYVAGTMALEDQLPSNKTLKDMLRDEQKKLLDSETTKIWDL